MSVLRSYLGSIKTVLSCYRAGLSNWRAIFDLQGCFVCVCVVVIYENVICLIKNNISFLQNMFLKNHFKKTRKANYIQSVHHYFIIIIFFFSFYGICQKPVDLDAAQNLVFLLPLKLGTKALGTHQKYGISSYILHGLSAQWKVMRSTFELTTFLFLTPERAKYQFLQLSLKYSSMKCDV